MLSPLLLAASLASAPVPADAAPKSVDRAAYESARDRAGADPASQVRLALWCEGNGFSAERLKHLSLAALRDPGNATARGLLGIVRFRDRWASPENVARQVGADGEHAARIAEYHKRRDQAGRTADGQARLAEWCEENGLADESRAHHAAVLQLDPDRKASRLKLGFKRDGRRWVTPEQLSAEKREAALQKEADRTWKAKLAEWRGWLDDRGDRRDRAEAELAGVDDPRAVPAIVAVFGRGGEPGRARAARMLGQIDAPASSRVLAGLAVFDPSAEIRRSATETLKRRDPREFAGLLVALLRDPIRFEVRHVGGPGSPGALFVGGKRFNVQRLYAPPAAPRLDQLGPNLVAGIDESGFVVLERPLGMGVSEDWWGFNPLPQTAGSSGLLVPAVMRVNEADALAIARGEFGVPEAFARFAPEAAKALQASLPRSARLEGFESRIRSEVAHSPDGKVNVHSNNYWEAHEEIPIGRMMQEAHQAALTAEQQLQSDVAALEAANRQIGGDNDHVGSVLGAISGRSLPSEPAAWRAWWVDQLGFRNDLPQQTSSVPTFVENVPLAYVPESAPLVVSSLIRSELTDFRAISCFGAGTPVRTLDGARPIESLRVGDLVLTQSMDDGSLGYQPVTRVHHNPPSPTFLVKVAGDTIVSSPFHRFWVAGRGWIMARDLDGGETLRLLGESRRVDSVEPGPVQPVFNLDVAGHHDFFAGRVAALVHDNTLPGIRQEPFDAAGRPAK